MAQADGRVTDQLTGAVRSAVASNRCAVALGGGADSAVLLWAATQALGTSRVRGVFVYHGLEASDGLRDAARRLVAHVGVDLVELDGVVADGGNLEARARSVRYAAIEGVLDEGEIAMTGHTADDQAETVVMRLVRGSGAGALAGIPSERGVWRRPLLDFSRAQLRQSASDLGLPFTDDPANDDYRFQRTRVRHAVMPVIESECGPNTAAMIRRSAALVGADDRVLQERADEIPLFESDHSVSIPLGALTTAPVPVASRAVRRGLRLLLGGRPGAWSDVEAVLAVAGGANPMSISAGLQVTREAPFVTIHRQRRTPPPSGFDIFVDEPFAWSGDRYLVSRRHSPGAAIPGGRLITLRADAVDGQLAVRGFSPGDRIELEVGSTPAKEVLRSGGVPSRLRPYSLVVTVDAKIAALAGLRVASWARPRCGEPAIIIEREVNT